MIDASITGKDYYIEYVDNTWIHVHAGLGMTSIAFDVKELNEFTKFVDDFVNSDRTNDNKNIAGINVNLLSDYDSSESMMYYNVDFYSNGLVICLHFSKDDLQKVITEFKKVKE